jgi:protein gp37
MTSEAYWKQALKWEEAAASENWDRQYPIGYRPRVFCASMADWLDDEVPIEWLADLLALIHKTPNLDWLLLTKRPENWRERLGAVMVYQAHKKTCFPGSPDELEDWLHDWRMMNRAPKNVWIGTSVENQEMADKRIPELLKIPAKVRFLSCEPLLGAVDIFTLPNSGIGHVHVAKNIQWVIAGGESGPGARPMHPDWVRSLRDQCQAAGVAFFFKQWGEWGRYKENGISLNDGDVRCWINDEAETGICSHAEHSVRVGKKAAGRILDGRGWNEFPARVR